MHMPFFTACALFQYLGGDATIFGKWRASTFQTHVSLVPVSVTERITVKT